MKIRIPLSGMFRGVKLPFGFDSPEVEKMLINKPVYLEHYKTEGRIVEVCPETDCVYAEVPDKEYSDLVVDSTGLNMCEFTIERE